MDADLCSALRKQNEILERQAVALEKIAEILKNGNINVDVRMENATNK
jgi:biotin synthase-related radical SAM superfamily protein